MPKRVDHDLRRRQIAEAVWRLASTNGLEDVTLRRVATEAGVSMRLVQYYFGTRHELLVRSLEILNTVTTERAHEHIAGSDGEPTPHGVLRTVLVEMLPLDEHRRMRYLVHLAYFIRSRSDEALAATFREAPPVLEETLAKLISWGKDTGAVDPAVDQEMEAELLLNSIDGLQTSVVLGQRTPEAAIALIDYQLDKIFRR